jgi:hypothetical protein
MLLSLGTLPWWAWLLCAAGLAVLSVFAAAFAVLPAETRPGGWGCLLVTVLLVLATLLTAGLCVMRVAQAWAG